jgi:hypothetical protein
MHGQLGPLVPLRALRDVHQPALQRGRHGLEVAVRACDSCQTTGWRGGRRCLDCGGSGEVCERADPEKRCRAGWLAFYYTTRKRLHPIQGATFVVTSCDVHRIMRLTAGLQGRG